MAIPLYPIFPTNFVEHDIERLLHMARAPMNKDFSVFHMNTLCRSLYLDDAFFCNVSTNYFPQVFSWQKKQGRYVFFQAKGGTKVMNLWPWLPSKYLIFVGPIYKMYRDWDFITLFNLPFFVNICFSFKASLQGVQYINWAPSVPRLFNFFCLSCSKYFRH